jgi:hypothetical protein
MIATYRFPSAKNYADFRKGRDEAFSDVDRALAKVSNRLQGRNETPDFHIDWSTAYGEVDRRDMSRLDIASGIVLKFIEITYVEHSQKWPYIILSQWMVCFKLDPVTNKQIFGSEATRQRFIQDVVKLLVDNISKWNVTVLIDGPNPVKELHRIRDDSGAFLKSNCRVDGLARITA